jgi:hypothetical protein
VRGGRGEVAGAVVTADLEDLLGAEGGEHLGARVFGGSCHYSSVATHLIHHHHHHQVHILSPWRAKTTTPWMVSAAAVAASPARASVEVCMAGVFGNVTSRSSFHWHFQIKLVIVIQSFKFSSSLPKSKCQGGVIVPLLAPSRVTAAIKQSQQPFG